MSGFCARFGFREPGLVEKMASRLRHRGLRRVHMRAPDFEAEALEVEATPFAAQVDEWSLVGDATIVALGSEPLINAPSDESATRVVDAFRERREATLPDINGDFALVLFDARSRCLYVARDRAGARPVYYARALDGWAFASEYKALLAVLGRKPGVDRQALAELQSRKIVPLGRTLLEGIRQLPSGSVLRLDGSGDPTINRYWEPRLRLEDLPYESHGEQLRKTFLAAVDRRMVDGKPLAISLSGGIDSIAIVAAARHVRPNSELLTFTAGDAPDDPELQWAARVSTMFGTNHDSIIADPARLTRDLPRLVWHLEDPIARTEVWQTQQLCEEVAPRARTILRGDGSDGMFGGMDRHQLLAWAAMAPPLRTALEDVYWFTQAGIRPRSLMARLAVRHYLASRIPLVPRVIGVVDAVVPEPLPAGGKELLNAVMVRGPIHALPMLLQKIERITSAFGMTTMSPFVDPDVIDVASRIPSRYKHDGLRNKKVLRDALRPLLPRELANRPKYAQRVRETSGFCLALGAIADRLLAPERVRARGFFEPADVARLLPRRADGTWAAEHAMRIWTLVLTELWARAFVDGDGSAAPAID